MIAKLQVILLCCGAVWGAPQDLNSLDYDYFDPNPTYDFAWEVNNQETFDEKSQQETLKDGTVEGSYSYLRPDGKIQIVTYRANDEIGFVVNIETIDVMQPFGKAGRPKSADSGFSTGSSKVLSNGEAYSSSSSTSSQSSVGASRSLSTSHSRSRSSVASQDVKFDGGSNINTFNSNSRDLNPNTIQRQSTISSSQNQKSKQQLAEQQLLNRQIQAQKERQQAQIQELARIQEQNIRVQQQQQQQQFAQQQQRIKQQQSQQQFNTQQQLNQQQQFHQGVQSNPQQINQHSQQQQVRQQNQHQEFSHQNQQQQKVTFRQKNIQNNLKQQVPQEQLQQSGLQSRNGNHQTFSQNVRQVLGKPVIPGIAKQSGSQLRIQGNTRIIPARVIPFPSQASNLGLNQSPVILARPTLNRARPSVTGNTSPSFTTNTRTTLSSLRTTTRKAPPPSLVETTTDTTIIQNSPTLAPIVRSKSKSSGQNRNRSQDSKIINQINNSARQLTQKRRGTGVAYVSFNSPTHEYSYPLNLR